MLKFLKQYLPKQKKDKKKQDVIKKDIKNLKLQMFRIEQALHIK